MELYGVIGSPIKHSLSPVLHNWAFHYLGYREKTYCSWEVKKEELKTFLSHLDLYQIKGLSVTIPLKEAVLNHVQAQSERVKEIKAANTLFKTSRGWKAENTDVYGFLKPLKDLNLDLSSALVLGAGGASRAVVYGLKLLGLKEIYLSNRTYSKAEKLAQEFDLISLRWEERKKVEAELIVNTTSLGLKGDKEGLTPWDYPFKNTKIAYDLIYTPLQTRFLAQAKKAGLITLSGLNMFVYQGLEQFRLFTGQEFPVAKAMLLLRQYL